MDLKELEIKLIEFFNKYQHMDKEELNFLIKNNFKSLILPNIDNIVKILENFIIRNLKKSDYNLIIFDWIDMIFNIDVYKQRNKHINQYINKLSKKDILFEHFFKIEIIKLRILRKLKLDDEIVNNKIKKYEMNINNYRKFFIDSYSNFTETIRIINEMFILNSIK